MPQKHKMKYPLLLWPFVAVWNLLALAFSITGRLLMTIVGLALMVIGITLLVTAMSVPIGIPLSILGLILMLRGIF